MARSILTKIFKLTTLQYRCLPQECLCRRASPPKSNTHSPHGPPQLFSRTGDLSITSMLALGDPPGAKSKQIFVSSVRIEMPHRN